MAHEIAGITKCNLCPPGQKGSTFTGPSVALIGNNPAVIVGDQNGKVQKLIQYVNQLSQHIIDKHAQQNEMIQYRALEYLSMLRLANFTTSDTALDEQIRFLRWSTLQQVLPIRLNDARLEEMAREFTNELLAIAQSADTDSTVGEQISKRLKEEFRRLADQYEQPGQFNINVVEVPKTT